MNLEQLRAELQSIEVADFASWPPWFRWSGILLVGALILFFGHRQLVLPEQLRLAEIASIESTLKLAHQTKHRRAAQLPLYEAQAADIRDRSRLVLHQLPTTTEMHTLLLDISQVGRESGLQMHTFEPGRRRAGAFYATLPIHISVSGSFNQLAEFVIGLTGLPRIVHISDMSLERGPEAMRMEAELLTYQYSEPDPPSETGPDPQS